MPRRISGPARNPDCLNTGSVRHFPRTTAACTTHTWGARMILRGVEQLPVAVRGVSTAVVNRWLEGSVLIGTLGRRPSLGGSVHGRKVVV